MENQNQVNNRRIKREKETVQAMIRLYCRAHHKPEDNLCADCQALANYALLRIDRCPFNPNKPTCLKCPVHCYQPEMREKIRTVMRFSGPRMLLYHPILTFHHLIAGLRKTSASKPKY